MRARRATSRSSPGYPPGLPHVCERGGASATSQRSCRATRAPGPAAPEALAAALLHDPDEPREVTEMPPWPRGWRLRRICESLLVVDRTVRSSWPRRRAGS